MNDLAEKALHGAVAAYRVGRSRAVVVAAVAGFALSVLVVVAGGRVGAARDTRPLSAWFGLQDTHDIQSSDVVPGTLMLIGVALLVVLWLLTVELVRRRNVALRGVWTLACCWALPFVLGPPLVDTSVYSYTAFGLLQRAGHDPYRTDATHLGYDPIVEAIDPGSRGAPSSTGPAGTLIQHVAVSVSAGHELVAVLLLRALAVVAVVWIGRLAADMGGRRPARALSLTALNPLLLIYVVSAAHLEGIAAALVLYSIVAANRRRWGPAVAAACVAGSIVGTAFVAVAAIIAVHVRGRRSRSVASVLGRDLLVAAVVVCGLGFGVNDGFGWVRTVHEQFSTHTPFAVTEGISKLFAPIVRDASYDDLTASARVAGMIAMACVVVYLLVTVGMRALERTTGYALLAIALLAPALYPWYLVPGIVAFAPSANAARKIWVLALSAGACLLMPGGFPDLTSDILTACALVVVAAITTLGLRRELTDDDAEEVEPVRAVAG